MTIHVNVHRYTHKNMYTRTQTKYRAAKTPRMPCLDRCDVFTCFTCRSLSAKEPLTIELFCTCLQVRASGRGSFRKRATNNRALLRIDPLSEAPVSGSFAERAYRRALLLVALLRKKLLSAKEPLTIELFCGK